MRPIEQPNDYLYLRVKGLYVRYQYDGCIYIVCSHIGVELVLE